MCRSPLPASAGCMGCARPVSRRRWQQSMVSKPSAATWHRSLVDTDINTRSRPPQLHGALAAAVALWCSLIVIAFPGERQ